MAIGFFSPEGFPIVHICLVLLVGYCVLCDSILSQEVILVQRAHGAREEKTMQNQCYFGQRKVTGQALSQSGS